MALRNKDDEPVVAELVDEPGTELAPADLGGSGAVPAVPVDNAALAAYLSGSETIQTQDPDEVVHGIVSRILDATSLDDVLNKQAVVKLKDYVGRPLVVQSVRWGESDYEGGVPFYAIVDAVVEATGEKVVASCGGQQVLAQLYMMARNNWLPARVTVDTVERPTRGGFYPIWLTAAPPAVEPQF